MGVELNRKDIGYTIISRFEEMFRDFISEKLTVSFQSFLDGIPTGITNKAKERMYYEDASGSCCIDFLEYTDFIDLKDIIIFNNNYESFFNQLEKQKFINLFVELYDLRCKIAHSRGNFNALDLDKLIEICRMIAKETMPFLDDLLNFFTVLENNPEEIELLSAPISFSCNECTSAIPNNIPVPDYEYEGGFVGREKDIKQITKLIEGDLHRVISITGAGGVGKTALALKVVNTILNKNKVTFDSIVWLSAKETKLSYLGIEDVEPTVKNYEELLDTILEVTGFGHIEASIDDKEKDVNIIFDTCKKILIVIDNLETITDEDIKNFILDSHKNLKILITSRKGLGQVNRVHELRELKEEEAIKLFRIIAREKRQDRLLSLNDEIIKNYVKKVSYYPLAIKWLIGQISKGKDIKGIIDSISESSSDISLFCFDQIYKDLSESAKKILCALSCFENAPQSGVLNYIVNIKSQNEFEDAIEELILVSLVIPEQYHNNQNQLSQRYALLPLTRGFVRKQLDKDTKLKREINERMLSIENLAEEAEKAKKQYRFSLANFGATTEEEKIASMLIQTAHQKYQSGLYDEAVIDYKRATKIAPDFPALYRNWAVMESNRGHYIEADKLMDKAIKLNSEDPQLWLVWGNMKMKDTNQIEDALQKFLMADKLNPGDYVIINAVGQAKCRLGFHKEADELFRKAFEAESTGSSRRHEIINRASLADNLRRWSEIQIKDRKMEDAESKLKEALFHIKKAYELDPTDSQSRKLLCKINKDLGYFYKNRNNDLLAIEYFKSCITNNPINHQDVKNTVIGSTEIAKIYYKYGKFDDVKKTLNKKILQLVRDPIKLANLESMLELINKSSTNGKIIRSQPDRGFIVIEAENVPGKTYLGFINNIVPDTDPGTENLLNKKVSFIASNDNGKDTAKVIRILT